MVEMRVVSWVGDAVMIAAARRFGNNRPCLTIETRTSAKARKTPVLRRYPVQVTVSQPFGRAAASAAAPRGPATRGAAIAAVAASTSVPRVLHGAHVVLGIGRAHAVAVQIHLLEDLGLDLVGRAHRGVAGRQEDAHPA